MNNRILLLIIILTYSFIFCENIQKDQSLQEELQSCEKEQENIENTFILKTNLSENEIEKLLSKDFSTLSNNKRKRPNRRRDEMDIKQFKSKNNLNKTILLMEINNISEYSYDKNENESKNNEKNLQYELIDVKENDETKIFLSFDKFFKSQYKEMFDYSYTIIMAFFVLLGMIIYYAFLLPNEADEISRSRGSVTNNFNIIQGNINNDNGVDNNYLLNE